MADSEEGGLGARRVRFKPGGKAGEGPLGPRPGFLSPGGKGGGEGGGDSGAYKNPLFAGSRSDPVRCGSSPGPPPPPSPFPLASLPSPVRRMARRGEHIGWLGVIGSYVIGSAMVLLLVQIIVYTFAIGTPMVRIVRFAADSVEESGGKVPIEMNIGATDIDSILNQVISSPSVGAIMRMMTPDGNEVDIVEVVEPGSVSKSLSLDDALPRVSALSREKGNRPGAGADAEPAAPEVPVLDILTEELGDGLNDLSLPVTEPVPVDELPPTDPLKGVLVESPRGDALKEGLPVGSGAAEGAAGAADAPEPREEGRGAVEEPAAPLSVADAAAEAFMAWCRSAPCMDGASMGCTEISRGLAKGEKSPGVPAIPPPREFCDAADVVNLQNCLCDPALLQVPQVSELVSVAPLLGAVCRLSGPVVAPALSNCP